MQEHRDLASNVTFWSYVVANPKKTLVIVYLIFYYYCYLFMSIVSLFLCLNKLGIKLVVGFFPCVDIEPT